MEDLVLGNPSSCVLPTPSPVYYYDMTLRPYSVYFPEHIMLLAVSRLFAFMNAVLSRNAFPRFVTT